MRILITGGAGFVGSSLASMLRTARSDFRVCAFDNLRRRGSELALARLAEASVEFVHGDVRCPDDLATAGPFDLLLDCSAEPSVHAGYGDSPSYVVQTNLTGTIHCLEEYRAMYGLPAVVNRCGVIAGPWQMGKVDQGFVVLWAARHLFGGPLSYIGFGGDGLQVRDVLHIEDLFDLVLTQIEDMPRYSGSVFNAGGGHGSSVSLAELTSLCRTRTAALPIASDSRTRDADVPYYVTDNTAVTAATGWRPRRTIDTLLDDVFAWLRANRATLEPLLSGVETRGVLPASR